MANVNAVAVAIGAKYITVDVPDNSANARLRSHVVATDSSGRKMGIKRTDRLDNSVINGVDAEYLVSLVASMLGSDVCCPVSIALDGRKVFGKGPDKIALVEWAKGFNSLFAIEDKTVDSRMARCIGEVMWLIAFFHAYDRHEGNFLVSRDALLMIDNEVIFSPFHNVDEITSFTAYFDIPKGARTEAMTPRHSMRSMRNILGMKDRIDNLVCLYCGEVDTRINRDAIARSFTRW